MGGIYGLKFALFPSRRSTHFTLQNQESLFVDPLPGTDRHDLYDIPSDTVDYPEAGHAKAPEPRKFVPERLSQIRRRENELQGRLDLFLQVRMQAAKDCGNLVRHPEFVFGWLHPVIT